MPDAQTLLDEIARRGADDDARREARLLLAHVLGRDPGWLRAHDDEPLDDRDVAAFRALWTRRQAGEPVAYLTGRRGFWTLDLETSPAVLIPRPETELLVEAALARLPPDAALDVVDLGTGSGAVALAIAAERPHYRVTATDVSHDALAIMRRNAERHGITNVEAIAGRWFEPLAGRRFHLIVSNPPYIADDDPHLRQGDLRFEPRDALASGPDGLDAIREIATGAGNHLHPGGWLLVEHGWEQATAVRELFEAAGLTAVASLRDLSGHERVTLGRQSGPADPATS